MKQPKPKKCKECKQPFKPVRPLQRVCSLSCSIEDAKKTREKKEAKEWKVKKVKMKEKLKTKSDYLKEVQVIFNKFIRERDKGLNCISCNKPAKKENAGHYRSVGGNPELRFNELNCHLQCEYCNTYLHSNAINYRINLIKKIGIECVEFLEGRHDPQHYTIDELKEMKVHYRNLIKEI